MATIRLIKQDSFVHNTIAKFYKMDGETEDYTVSGTLLNNAGIKLKQAFGGTGFDDETRLFKDFSSRMYFFEKV
jgi:alpha-galactosidase